MAKELTAKQEAFCVARAKKGMSYADAYRAAFDCSKMKPEAIYVEASRLKDNPKVSLRIKKLQDMAAAEAMVTLAGHLEDLKTLRDMAMEKGQLSAAINAEISRGKACGLYVEKAEVSGPNGSAISIVAFDGGVREPV